MPNSNPSNTQPTNHHGQPKRSSTALYGMLRKTKNKTYHAFRSSHSRSRKDEGSSINEEERTPKMMGGRIIQPSDSFYFSPQNSWDVTLRRETVDSSIPNRDLYLDDTVREVISGVESSLRRIVIVCVVFIAGTMMPEEAYRVQKLLELTMVAWGTCLAIIGLVWFRDWQQQNKLRDHDGVSAVDTEVDLTGPPDIHRRATAVLSTDQSTEVIAVTGTSDHGSDEDRFTRNQLNEMEVVPLTKKISPTKPFKEPTFMPPHLQQLEDLYIMLSGERLSPNGVTIPISTDFFEGEMLLMFRTSHVDEPPNTEEDPIVAHFRGKQRRFEWQWQLRLKQVPNGDLYVGCELEEPPAMGMIQRALVNTALKFVKKTNQGFGYYFSDTNDSPSYLSFPVGTSMDRFVATKPGEDAPQLGREIYEDADAMKRRKRGAPIEWNTRDTYTMALWSAYFDWNDWQILNFPGIRPFSATSVAGVQPIKVNLYTISSAAGQEAVGDNPPRDVLFALEVSNARKAALGQEAKAWRAKQIDRAGDLAARILNYEEETGDDVDGENTEDEYEDADAQLTLDMPPTLGNIEPNDYVTSGTCLSLREGSGSFLASGGGYALLQSSSTSVIVLEKVFRSKKAFSYIQKSGMVSDPQMVIRNGDAVRVKLVNLTSNATKYLRIHRGWWLRWTSNRPAKTSSFYISTNDPEATALLLGTPFSLISRKWSNYHVGVCNESSAKYGGRMLAMFKAGKSTVEEEPAMECDEDDEPMDDDEDKDFVNEKPSNNTTMPLLLRAESTKSEPESPSPSKRRSLKIDSQPDQSQLASMTTESTVQKFELDCPVWLEVMNKASRMTQLVYAVRVKEIQEASSKDFDRQSSELSESDALRDSTLASPGFASNVSLKLRSGKDIAPILNLGIHHKNDLSANEGSFAWQITNLQVEEEGGDDLTTEFTGNGGLQRNNSFSSSSDESYDEMIEDEPMIITGPNEMPTSTQDDLYAAVFPEEEESVLHAIDNKLVREASLISEDDSKAEVHDGMNSLSCNTQSVDTSTSKSAVKHHSETPKSLVSQDTTTTLEDENAAGTEKKKKKNAKVLNRVAKTVKSSTVITGKQVIKQSKKVGKATVNTGLAAGRAIPNAYKPPKKHEPGGRFSSKKAAKNNSMKHVGRAIKNMEGWYCSEMHSGQLTAPDLSKEKISQILHQLSMNKSLAVLEALSSFSRTSSEQDLAFLRGCSAELGVIPIKAVDAEVDYDCICARAIWEGRWREECCMIYGVDNHIAFYAPLSRSPTLVVGFEEILAVRKCDLKPELSPLPGLPLLSIDTTWRCHYLAFLSDADRDSFLQKINDMIFHAQSSRHLTTQTGKIAQVWEGYKMSLETSFTGSGGKWAPVMIGKKSKQKRQRRIFNSRRMTFDLKPVVDYRKIHHERGTKMGSIAVFVEELLHKALSLSPEALDSAESSFLDEVSRLRCINLQDIEYDSKDALCIFVNLYHCLLQHALLFAVDGLPDKRSITRFKRCSCYEIGGDVFSLAELECCVIRGKLSKAVGIKSPLVDAAKTSRPYLRYALEAADNRVNFYVNTGSTDHPSSVPVFRSEILEDQIQAVSSAFLTNQVEINVKKRFVTLPKICDIYRNDFGMGDCLVCLSQILRNLDETNQLLIASLLENGGQITVRFKQPSERFHTNLTERIDVGVSRYSAGL